MTEIFGNFIAGDWVESSSGKTFESVNPANYKEVVARYQASTLADVNKALEAAGRAQEAWAGMPAPLRGTILMRSAELLEKQAEQVAIEMTREKKGKRYQKPEGKWVEPSTYYAISEPRAQE